MHLTAIALSLALALASPGAGGRPRLEQDECSRRTAECERRCDSRDAMGSLSCKTDCRLAETECRNRRK